MTNSISCVSPKNTMLVWDRSLADLQIGVDPYPLRKWAMSTKIYQNLIHHRLILKSYRWVGADKKRVYEELQASKVFWETKKKKRNNRLYRKQYIWPENYDGHAPKSAEYASYNHNTPKIDKYI